MKALVSGSRSGLGAYLHRSWPGSVGLTRESNLEGLRDQSFDVVVHCAVDARRSVPRSEMGDFSRSNFELTRTLLAVPAACFVYVSSVDVYPATDGWLRESDDFVVGDAHSLYAIGKVLAETMVEAAARPSLILRPTALLGETMRKNSLVKLLFDPNPKLTLAADSEFNYVGYDQVRMFVERAAGAGVTGTFNLAASANVTLGEIAARFERRVEFGGYRYRCGRVDNAKAREICPDFARSSLDLIGNLITSAPRVVRGS